MLDFLNDWEETILLILANSDGFGVSPDIVKLRVPLSVLT